MGIDLKWYKNIFDNMFLKYTQMKQKNVRNY